MFFSGGFFSHFVSMFHGYETRKLRHYRIFFAQVDDVRLPGAFDNLTKRIIIIIFIYLFLLRVPFCLPKGFPLPNHESEREQSADEESTKKKDAVFKKTRFFPYFSCSHAEF